MFIAENVSLYGINKQLTGNKSEMRMGIYKLFKSEEKLENSNELCKTKLYYATRQHCICVQNNNYLCLRAARKLGASI